MFYSGPAEVLRREETEGLKSKLERDVEECAEGEDVRAVAYVSKLFAVKRGSLPRVKGTEKEREREKRRKADSANAKLSLDGDSPPSPAEPPKEVTGEEEQEMDPESEILLGFARLYSGTLSLPSPPTSSSPSSSHARRLFLLLPKYNPSLPRTHPKNKPYMHGPIVLTGLYEMMGRELVPVESVRAGSVCAIEANGLDGGEVEGEGVGGVARGGTLVEEGDGDGDGEWVNLAGVGSGVAPIVRVALEPKEPGELFVRFPPWVPSEILTCVHGFVG